MNIKDDKDVFILTTDTIWQLMGNFIFFMEVWTIRGTGKTLQYDILEK